LDQVVNRRSHERTVMVGVSMGGAIATIYAEQFPSALDGLVLVVPMHLPYYAKFPEDVAAVIGAGAVLARKQHDYALGQGDPEATPEFESNDGSQSQARFDAWRRTISLFPDVDLGGPTYGWAWEALKATKAARVQAFKITVPTLMLQAGRDQTVNNRGSTAVCQRIRHCRRVVYPNAAHGMFYETDANRDQALAEVHAFVDGLHPGPGCSSSNTTPVALLLLALLARRHMRLT
jgi:lysophospholipase